MRFLTIFLVISVFACAYCKNNVKALTESLGQQVIELGTPIKELPMELEEEPSAEVDDEDKEETKKPAATIVTIPVATKKDVKKTTSVDTRRKNKEADDEDDARIEKELAEIYKDTDYKDAPNASAAKNVSSSKEALRSGNSFKFQPDLTNQREIERFRTSIDDITCAKSVTRLDDRGKKTNKAATRSATNGLLFTVIHLGIIGSIC